MDRKKIRKFCVLFYLVLVILFLRLVGIPFEILAFMFSTGLIYCGLCKMTLEIRRKNLEKKQDLKERNLEDLDKDKVYEVSKENKELYSRVVESFNEEQQMLVDANNDMDKRSALQTCKYGIKKFDRISINDDGSFGKSNIKKRVLIPSRKR